MWKKYFLKKEGSITLSFIIVLPLFLLIFVMGLLESRIISKKIDQNFKTFVRLRKMKSIPMNHKAGSSTMEIAFYSFFLLLIILSSIKFHKENQRIMVNKIKKQYYEFKKN